MFNIILWFFLTGILHLYDLSVCFWKCFTNSISQRMASLTLEGTLESVWTCACPRLVERGIGAELK